MAAHLARVLITWFGTSSASGLVTERTSTVASIGWLPQADSTELLRDARSAQRRFESIKRGHLPRTYASSGHCDLRFGAYCFTFGDDDRPAWVPPPEHARVIDERHRLVTLLDSIAQILPGDEWIMAQRVRYVVEEGEPKRALDNLNGCMTSPGWLCDALRGYLLHLLERYVDAEQAFEQSLQAMDEKQRCNWEDLSEILDGRLRGEYRRQSCNERSALQRAILVLADPMYGVPGNELWTEHLSRNVVSVMYRQARGTDGDPWSRDIHRILLRYGWPTGWEQLRNPPSSAIRPPVTTHYGTDGSKFFMPDEPFVNDFPNVDGDEWDLQPRRPQSNHNPAYAKSGFESMSEDLPLFRIGDSALVIASFEVQDDSIGIDDEIDVALGLLANLDEQPKLVRDHITGPRGTLWTTAAPTPQLVSIEALSTTKRRAARSRRGVDLGRLHRPGLVASDILILQPADPLPDAVRNAIPSIRASVSFAPGDTLTIYWEIYGLDRQSDIRTTLSLRKTSKGIFRRLAELTPFADAETALSLAWSDIVVPRDGVVPRAVTVALPIQASNGRYVFTLATEAAEQRTILEKSIEIRNQ